MAAEPWLRTNTRAVLLGMVVPGVVALLGLALLVGMPAYETPTWLRVTGGVLLAVALAVLAALAWQLRLPRVSFENGELLFRLRAGLPIRVPVSAVECFWLGQAPSQLPGERHRHTETAAVVVRIADKAVEWHHQSVKPQLGKWCDGYVTILGTWCEPLNIDVVQRMNMRLAEVSGASSQIPSPAGEPAR